MDSITFLTCTPAQQSRRRVVVSFAVHGRRKPKTFPRKACPELGECR